MHTYAAAVALSVLGSLGGLLTASTFLLLGDAIRIRLVPWLISYAVGTLLGVALLALLPEALGTLPPTSFRVVQANTRRRDAPDRRCRKPRAIPQADRG